MCPFLFFFSLQDVIDVKIGATDLVDRCLLNFVDEKYRLHDLVLEYLQMTTKMDEDLARKASSRQASFLSRIEVLRRFGDNKLGVDGLYSLVALWSAVEKLDGSLIAEKFYRESLGSVTKVEDMQNAGQLFRLLVSFFPT